MTKTPERHLPLEGSFNIRDLGGYHIAEGRTTQWGQVFRADSLHRLSEEAQNELLERGIRTVIDLRGAGELEAAPNPFAAHPEVDYVNISLFEPLYLSGSLGGGNRNGLDLPELYRLALEHSQAPMRQTLETIANADGPVLFHCTAGKDRTGLVAALVLGVAGVHADHIVEDYAATTHYAAGLMDHLRQEASAKGHDLSAYNKLLLSEPEFMRETLEHLEQAYGGVEGYLEKIGLEAEVVEKLRQKLV